MRCEWVIESVLPIMLTFQFFDTESYYDFLRVYDGNSTAATLVGTFSGSALPPAIIATSGAMLVTFASDATEQRYGTCIDS